MSRQPTLPLVVLLALSASPGRSFSTKGVPTFTRGRANVFGLRTRESRRNRWPPWHPNYARQASVREEAGPRQLGSSPLPRTGVDEGGTGEGAEDLLSQAFGAGQGKHAGKERRRHKNKYAAQSKSAELDPWEQEVERSRAEAEAPDPVQVELAERHEAAREERGDMEYPDTADIDPYDPTTFGFIEVASVLGAHGVNGELKVRSSSGFGPQRLCMPGLKYLKAPNRRVPREVYLCEGRLQKEDIFLVKLEEVTTREEAAALRTFRLYVLEEERPELGEGEYLVHDLVGASAYLFPGAAGGATGPFVGEVVGVVVGEDMSATSGMPSDLLEVQIPPEVPGMPPKICLVPFVPEIVPLVQLDATDEHGTPAPRVLLDPPTGLLELAVEVEERVRIRGFLDSDSTGRAAGGGEGGGSWTLE